MPRGPRSIPPRWTVEIVTRTICGFFLLPATTYFARVFVGSEELFDLGAEISVVATCTVEKRTPLLDRMIQGVGQDALGLLPSFIHGPCFLPDSG